MDKKQEVMSLMVDLVAKENDQSPDSVDIKLHFQELGLDSISSIFILNDIEEKYNIRLKTTDLWNYPTIDQLSDLVISKINAGR